MKFRYSNSSSSLKLLKEKKAHFYKMHFSRKSVDKKRSEPGSGGTGLSSQRQADLHDTSLVWRVSSGTARMTQKNPVSKDKKKGGVVYLAIIQRTVLCCLILHPGNNLGLTNPLNFKVSSLSYKSPKQYGIISLTGTDTTLEANAYMVSGDCTIGSVESSRNMLSSCKGETCTV